MVQVRWAPHPVIVTIRNSKDYMRVLLSSSYLTITGRGVLLRFRVWGLGLWFLELRVLHGKEDGNCYLGSIGRPMILEAPPHG